MTGYGADVRLDGHLSGDLITTPTADLEPISGPALVAQDIAEEVVTPLGSLPWDRSAGSNLPRWLNSPHRGAPEVLAELRRVAAKDPRVDVLTIAARQDGDRDRRYLLSFRTLGSTAPVELAFDVQALTAHG